MQILEEGEDKLILRFDNLSERAQWRSILEDMKISTYIDERNYASYSIIQAYFLDAEKNTEEIFKEVKNKATGYAEYLDRQSDDYPKLIQREVTENYICLQLMRNKTKSFSKRDEETRISFPATYFNTKIYIYKRDKVYLLITNYSDANKTQIEKFVNHIKTCVIDGNMHYIHLKKDFSHFAIHFDKLKSIKFDPHFNIPKNIEEKIKSQYGDEVEVAFSDEIKIEKDESQIVDLKAIPEIVQILEDMNNNRDEGIINLKGKKMDVTTEIIEETNMPTKIRIWPPKAQITSMGELEYLLFFLANLKTLKRQNEEIQTRASKYF